MRTPHRWWISLAVSGALGACGSPHDSPMPGSATSGSAGMSGGPATASGGAGGAGGNPAIAAGSSGVGTASGGTNASAGAPNAAGGTPSAGGTGAGGTSAGAGGPGQAGTGGASVNPGDLPATTLHLAGDSTVMYYAPPSAQEGWGQELAQFFIGKVTIDNQALGGSSVQTFHDGSRWANILASLKAGDYVMADFGINDSGTVAGRSVTPTDFQKLLLMMSSEVKAKQATFIIVTPSALQYWSGGMDGNTRLAPYVAVENSLGTMNQIPIEDLNARSLEFLDMIGQTAAMQIYINGDKAHFTKLGATKMAEFVAAELRRIGNPLAQYLK